MSDPRTTPPGFLEVGAVNGQVVIYIPALDRHVAFSPDEAVLLASLISDKAMRARLQERADA